MVANGEGPKERDLWNLIPTQQGSERGQTYFDLSLIAFENAQHTKSLALAESACVCFSENANELGLANCQTSIAFNLKQLGKPKEAIRVLIKAIVGYSKVCDSQEWQYRTYLADWFQEEGEIELSLIQLNRCLEYYRSENSIYDIANTCSRIASLMCDLDKCSESIEKLQEARAIFKNEKEPALVGATDIEIARCFNHLNDGVNAQAFAEKALGVFDSIKNEVKRAQSYAQLGRALNFLGDFQAAHDNLTIAHEIVTSLAPVNFYAVYMIQKAKVTALRGLGKEEEADEIQRRNTIINETLEWDD